MAVRFRCSVVRAIAGSALASVAFGQFPLELVSRNNEQAPGTGPSWAPFLDASGQRVALSSSATNFEPNPLGYGQVFVRDRVANTMTRASIATGGALANDTCTARGISRDGRYVLFDALATNLLAPDHNGDHVDTFVFDTLLGTTTLASRASNGAQANSSTLTSALSGDGRRAVFSSYATNLDPLHATFGPADVYVRALDLQTTVLVSLSTAGVKGDAESGYSSVAASFDGSSIAFTSSATNLVANDTNARTDIFVRDMAQATTTRISVATGGAQSMGTCTETAITADGRFVVFTSDATDLVPQPMAPLHARIYVHDRLTGETTLASRAHDGSAANGTCYGPSISDDGRRVAFVSGATNLVSGDTNGKADLFVHDRWTSATRLVSVTSGGTQANYRVDTGALSGDGRVAAFATLAWNIYPNDSNGGSDVFASFGPSAPVVYCQPKVNSLGCTPAIGSTGTPSASAPQAFVVTASNVLNQRTGLLFYGYAVNAAPFQGGTLCVLPPTRRTTLQTSGGSTSGDDCSGAYAFDINAHTQSSVDPNLTSGAVVCCQYCSRDPASPSTTGLTAGLLFEIQP